MPELEETLIIQKICESQRPFCKEIVEILTELKNEHIIFKNSLEKFYEFYKNSSFAICPQIVIMEYGRIGISLVINNEVILTSVF